METARPISGGVVRMGLFKMGFHSAKTCNVQCPEPDKDKEQGDDE